MNKIQSLLAVALLSLAGVCIQAQTTTAQLSALLDQHLVPLNTPVTIGSQTFLVLTNASGGYTFVSYGAAGSVTNTPPTTITGVAQQAEQMVASNDPSLAGYYSTNELVGSLGAVYVQNSGQGAVKVSIEDYGLVGSLPSWALGAAVLQGNNGGKSSTAGGYAFVDYRRIIGSVAAELGVGGGYDNWNTEPMGLVQFEVEKRTSKNLGYYVGLGYALEPRSNSGNGGGLIAGGGVRYSFATFNPF